jgi:hypothetical protein
LRTCCRRIRTAKAGGAAARRRAVDPAKRRGYEPRATDGFQEVISDLYDGFLSAEDRRGVKKPDYETIPPLVKWGEPTSGPYTLPVDATSSFGMDVGTYGTPFATGCTMRPTRDWASISMVAARSACRRRVAARASDKVAAAVAAAKLGNPLAEYWADRIDETASDVLGILNLGPAAAVGVLATSVDQCVARLGTGAVVRRGC